MYVTQKCTTNPNENLNINLKQTLKYSSVRLQQNDFNLQICVFCVAAHLLALGLAGLIPSQTLLLAPGHRFPLDSLLRPFQDTSRIIARLRLDRHDLPEPKTKSKIYFEEKFKELDSDQIEGAEFDFLGLETRFKRNKRQKS